MSSTGEIQRKGFLHRRCWKLLDGRGPFPGTQYGPGHIVGAQQTRLPQRGLVLGHPSAHGPLGETQKKEPPCLQPGGTRQWRPRDTPAVCSFTHSFIHSFKHMHWPSTPHQPPARYQGFNTRVQDRPCPVQTELTDSPGEAGQANSQEEQGMQ